MQPLVSILIPCHNAERWLGETLESALAQTWPEKEIIVVDDGSTDASANVAQSFADRGVRLIRQANAGASAARNAAFDAGRGEWIQFLDADDLLAPDKIEQQMTKAQQTGPEYILSARWARFTDSPANASFKPERLCRDSDPVEWMITKLEGSAMMHPAAWLTSRSLLTKAGRWDEALSLDDDGEYFSRVILASKGVRYCESAIAYYRSNLVGSLSGRRSVAAWQSAFRSHQLYAGHLLSAEDSERTHRTCATMFQRLAYQAYPDAPDISAAAEREAMRYGGSDLRIEGGRIFKAIAACVGWKLAKRLHRWRESFLP